MQYQFERQWETNPEALRGPRVHAIIGTANGASPAQDDLIFFLDEALLPSDRSDLVVCAQSQQGARLASGAISRIEGVTHMQEGDSDQLQAQVLEYLNTKAGDEKFDGRGMPPSSEPGLEVPFFACPVYEP